MSLRARILGLVIATNLAATLVLGSFVAVDGKKQDKLAEESREKLLAAGRDRVQASFLDDVLDVGINLPVLAQDDGESSDGSWDVSTSNIYVALEDHNLSREIEHGNVLQCVVLEGNSERLNVLMFLPSARGGAEARPGAGGGYITYEHLIRQRVQRALRSAETSRSSSRRGTTSADEVRVPESLGTTASGSSWFAVPVWLRRSASSGQSIDLLEEKRLWGGMYFVMAPPPVQEEWKPLVRSSLYWVMGISTVLLVVLTWWVLDRWVLRPVRELADGAARVRAGDYTAPVHGGVRRDEIHQTVIAFNRMMDQVRESQRDLTERVNEATLRAEATRRRLVIAQRLAATGTLASGIAHEINNPLGGLRNATARLRKESESGHPDPDLERRYLDLLDDGLVRIQQIVRRVLAFSPRQVQPTEVSVRELAQKAVALAEHRAQKARVAIEVRGVDGWVLAEPGEIQQVLLNLLLNACDAMQEEGGRVDVRIEQEGDLVRVEVEDQGPGMSEEVRERVFDLFFTTKEVGQGTGLGLSVAHHIVEQHGGKLTVHPAPGGGSLFRMELPRAGT